MMAYWSILRVHLSGKTVRAEISPACQGAEVPAYDGQVMPYPNPVEPVGDLSGYVLRTGRIEQGFRFLLRKGVPGQDP